MVICLEAPTWSFQGSLRTMNNDQCLEGTNPKKAGTSKCEANNKFQNWQFSVSTGEIKSKDGLCLQAHTSGTVSAEPCSGPVKTTPPSQQWKWDTNSGPELRAPLFSDAEERSIIGVFSSKASSKRHCLTNTQDLHASGDHGGVSISPCDRQHGLQNWRLQCGSKSMAMIPIDAGPNQEMVICQRAEKWGYHGLIKSESSKK